MDDLTAKTQFHHSTWITAGRVFSTSLPQVVYDKKRELFRVPDLFLTHFPTSVTLVHEFINHPLPLQSSSLSFHQDMEWFSTRAPLTNPEILLTRTIPPEKVLKNLEKVAGQMWFDGASSVMDPRFNNGTKSFPLWVLSLWGEMRRMVEDQKRWKSSVHWLGLKTHPKGIATDASSLIERLPWNKPLHFGGASTLQFADFLGVSWLSDTQIDMMVSVLGGRMNTERHMKGALIEPLVFAWELASVGNGWKEPLTSPYLSRLADEVQAGTKTIWFPIHVSGCHWVAGRMDFENHTFAFGGSDYVYHV